MQRRGGGCGRLLTDLCAALAAISARNWVSWGFNLWNVSHLYIS
jgi:hypothetical protein